MHICLGFTRTCNSVKGDPRVLESERRGTRRKGLSAPINCQDVGVDPHCEVEVFGQAGLQGRH